MLVCGLVLEDKVGCGKAGLQCQLSLALLMAVEGVQPTYHIRMAQQGITSDHNVEEKYRASQ